jgi:hypothetical protein
MGKVNYEVVFDNVRNDDIFFIELDKEVETALEIGEMYSTLF